LYINKNIDKLKQKINYAAPKYKYCNCYWGQK
jgi:hypothetical protein